MSEVINAENEVINAADVILGNVDDNSSLNFGDILYEAQKFITHRYSKMINKNMDSTELEQLDSILRKWLADNRYSVEGIDSDELVVRLMANMSGFGLLDKYMNRKDVEEINVNGYDNVLVKYNTGEIKPSDEQFVSPQHARNIVSRLLQRSGNILDEGTPTMVGNYDSRVRITALCPPVIDEARGVIASIRIVNPQKLEFDDFIKKGTATKNQLLLMMTMIRYGVSICIAGSTGSGKTTFMSWLLSTIPNNKRLYTVENNTREFDLVKRDADGRVVNNVVHTVTNVQSKTDSDRLLEIGLTMDPDIICMAEMKGSEAFAAQEAGRTGHTVITTIHANGCEATYMRMVTLCQLATTMNEKTLYSLVTEAYPIVCFFKQLEDNSRRMMEMTECIAKSDGSREIRTLYRFKISKVSRDPITGKTTIEGKYVKVNNISESLQKRLLENGLPLTELSKFITVSEKKGGAQ